MSKRRGNDIQTATKPAVSHADDAILDLKEVAKFCNVSYWTVRRWIVTGTGVRTSRYLKAAIIGGRLKVRRSSLDSFLEAS